MQDGEETGDGLAAAGVHDGGGGGGDDDFTEPLLIGAGNQKKVGLRMHLIH